MRCEDVRGSLPARALGEIAGPDREAVEAHLAGCPACAAVATAQGAVPDALRAWPDAEGSAARRERIVRAMSAEAAAGRRGDAGRRRRFLGRGAAAAAVLAAGALGWRALTDGPAEPWSLEVRRTAGVVRIRKSGDLAWRTAATGDRVGEGDLVLTAPYAMVAMKERRDGAAAASLTLRGGGLRVGETDSETGERRMAIEGDRGGLHVSLPLRDATAFRIYDEEGRSVRVAGGDYEFGFQRVPAVPSAAADPAPAAEEDSDPGPGGLVFRDAPLTEVCGAIGAKTGRRIDVPASLSDRRISMAGPRDEPEVLWDAFNFALRNRNIAAVPAGGEPGRTGSGEGRWKLLPYEPAQAGPGEPTEARLTVRVFRGSADLQGAEGERLARLTDRQETVVAGAGRPATDLRPVPRDLDRWWEMGADGGGDSPGVPFALTGLTIRQFGRVSGAGSPLFEYEVMGDEVLARAGDARIETVLQSTRPIVPDPVTGEAVIQVRVRVRK